MSLLKQADFLSVRTRDLSWLDASGNQPIAHSLLTIGQIPRMPDRASWTLDLSLNTLTLGGDGVLTCSGDLLLANGVVVESGGSGSVGPTGPASSVVGATGATGAMGPAGPTGAVGAIGGIGTIGPTGVSGPVGGSGSMGDTGDTGPTGADGPQGEMGATGPTGPNEAANAPTAVYALGAPFLPPGIPFTRYIGLFGAPGDYVVCGTLTFNGPIQFTGGLPRISILTTAPGGLLPYVCRSITYLTYDLQPAFIPFSFVCNNAQDVIIEMADCVVGIVPSFARQALIDYTYL